MERHISVLAPYAGSNSNAEPELDRIGCDRMELQKIFFRALLMLLQYCVKYFLTLDQISEQTGISTEHILMLIEAKCVPDYAYEIFGELNSYNYISGQHCEKLEKLRFYSKSLLEWVPKVHAEVQIHGSQKTRKNLFAQFEKDLYQAAISSQIYESVTFKKQLFLNSLKGNLPEIRSDSFSDFAKEHWDALVKGGYSICLKNVCASSILAKEFALARIKEITDSGQKTTLDLPTREILIRYLRVYDAVCLPFAPHERALSSRGQWFDRMIDQYQLRGLTNLEATVS